MGVTSEFQEVEIFKTSDGSEFFSDIDAEEYERLWREKMDISETWFIAKDILEDSEDRDIRFFAQCVVDILENELGDKIDLDVLK